MNLTEKAAYIKGLADGLSLSTESAEGKIISELISYIEENAKAVTDLQEGYSILANQVDDIDEDLSYVEEELYGDDFDDCDDDDCDCGCGCGCEDDEEFFEVDCPVCKEKIYLDEDTADKDTIKCPACGTELSVEFEEDEE